MTMQVPAGVRTNYGLGVDQMRQNQDPVMDRYSPNNPYYINRRADDDYILA
jgi:hypothetical protein